MPIPVVCGSCQIKLVAPNAATGKKVKCKNCQAVISVPEAESSDFEFVDDAETVAPKPSAAKPKTKPAIIVDDEEDEIPQPKKKTKSRVVVEDDDDEDDEAPRQSKKKPKVATIEDDEADDEAPKKKKKVKGKKPAKKNNPLLLVGIGAGALFAVGFLGVMIWYVAIRDKSGTAGTNGGAGVPNPIQRAKTPPPNGWTKHDMSAFSYYSNDSWGAPKVNTQAEMVTVGAGAKGNVSLTWHAFPPDEFQLITLNPDRYFPPAREVRGSVTTVFETTFQQDGFSGREYKVKSTIGKAESAGYMRMIYAHNRLYTFSIGGDGISPESESYRVFFDNIQLKP